MNIIFLSDSVNEDDLGLYADEENLFVSEDYLEFLNYMHYQPKSNELISILNTYPNNISNYFSFDVDMFIQRLKNLGIYDNRLNPPPPLVLSVIRILSVFNIAQNLKGI